MPFTAGMTSLSNENSSLMTPAIVTEVPLSRSVFPITPRSPPTRRRQYPCIRLTLGVRPGTSSSEVNTRPIAPRAPKSEKNEDDTRIPSTRSGLPSPPPVTLQLAPMAAATCSNAVVPDLMSRYWPTESQSRGTLRPGDRCQTIAIRSALLYGSGRRISALATLKIAVFAPMPIASETIAIAANTGDLPSTRTPWRRSLRQVAIHQIVLSAPVTHLLATRFSLSEPGLGHHADLFRAKTGTLPRIVWRNPHARARRAGDADGR